MEDNYMIVIFGSTGDLTKRKLIPALYNLYRKGKLEKKVPIVCVARRKLSQKEFIESLQIEQHLKKAKRPDVKAFLSQVEYHSFDFTKQDITKLEDHLCKIDSAKGCKGNVIFYLATPPFLFSPFVDAIKGSNLLKRGWNRVVFEKPFGYDLKTAKELNQKISSIFDENEIYRIDHYLGKELVQNILTLRFENAIFEQVWNNHFLDHVQVTISEQLGVENRGGYYESSGAIRDMVQNHLMQILALVAMEEPSSLEPDDIRNEKVKVLKHLMPIRSDNVVLGQYGKGRIAGKPVPGYREEKGVDPHSTTETFMALKAEINTKRWSRVPFYMRTGKRLKMPYAEVNLVFKDVECHLFNCKPGTKGQNIISVRIQPEDGVVIRFNSKVPGSRELYPVAMEFCHKCEFGTNTPEAYEKLFQDIIKGDQTLFTRWDEVELSWDFIDPLEKIKREKSKHFPNYEAGSMGPKGSDGLIGRDGRDWVLIERKLTI